MSREVVVVNKLPAFRRNLYKVLDDGIREAARDTFIKARQRAPYDKGGLRGQSDFKRKGPMFQRVSFWIEYARFQEFGGDSKRRVRHYTTPGTGAHFLRKSGDEAAKKLTYTLKKHAGMARP